MKTKIIQKTLRNKKILLLVTFLISSVFATATYGVTCWPTWDGTRNVEGTCDFPVGYRIYGDINVGGSTVNVTNGTMGVNLATNKITFTTGKVMFSNGKADGTVGSRYSQNQWYRNPGPFTNCTAGVVMRPDMGGPVAYGTRYNGVAGDGWMYCAK